ncbi:MAG: hypothetical protein LAT82_00555 [Nanoarchaeota archaeon]|nr:hypothetical protein [Nanoarchaeota archaeon]
MFEFQCMQYLKELEQIPQDSSQYSQLRELLLNLINQNSSKVDSFLSSFNLTQKQKEIFLEVLQEAQNNSSSTNNNSLDNISNNHNNNSNNSNNFNSNLNQDANFQEEFFNKTLEYFNEWREEYFKLRSVSPKCIDISQNYIENLLVKDELYSSELIEMFQSLPTNNNDAFENFKNHVINVLISQLIELIDKELILVKTSSLNFFKKVYLSYEFEKLQRKLSKRDISVLEKLYDKFDESYVFRGEHN